MKVTSEQAKQLLTDQLSVWESARDNYKALEAVQVKELTVEGCTVKIQFNPARIVSSAAKVDTQSLKERKCFLFMAMRACNSHVRIRSLYKLLAFIFSILSEASELSSQRRHK